MLGYIAENKVLVFILIISIFIRLAILAMFSNIEPAVDMLAYYSHAVGLSRGNGYVSYVISEDGAYEFDKDDPTAYRPVGYVAFLALIMKIFGSENIIFIQLTQILLSTLIVLLAYRIAYLLSQDTLSATLAATIMAIYPNQIAYSIVILTETLALFLLMLSVYVFLIGQNGFRYSILCGVLVGISVFVKPQFILLPGVFFLLRLFGGRGTLRQRMVFPLLCTVVAFLVQVPWIARNYSVFHQLVWVSTNGGINLLIGNNPYATGEYIFNSDVIQLFAKDGLNEAELDKRAQAVALEYILQNPLEVLRLLPAKVYHTYRDGYDGIGWVSIGLDGQGNDITRIYSIISQVIWRILLVVFSVTALFVVVWRRKRHAFLLNAAMIGYLTCLVLIYFGGERFRFIIDPWIILFVAPFLSDAIRCTNSQLIKPNSYFKSVFRIKTPRG